MDYSLDAFFGDCNFLKREIAGALGEVSRGIEWGWGKASNPEENTIEARVTFLYGRGNEHPYISLTEIVVSEVVKWGTLWCRGEV